MQRRQEEETGSGAEEDEQAGEDQGRELHLEHARFGVGAPEDRACKRETDRVEDALGEGAHPPLDSQSKGDVVGVADREEDRIADGLDVDVHHDRSQQPRTEHEEDQAAKREQRENEIAQQRSGALEQKAGQRVK